MSISASALFSLSNKFLLGKVVPYTMEMFNFKVFVDMGMRTGIKHDLHVNNLNPTSAEILINQGEIIKRLRVRQLGQQKS